MNKHFIKNELKKLEDIIAPFTKKVRKYSFWAMPLLIISVLNLVELLFFESSWEMPLIFLYAVIGAFGMAMAKEAKLKRKEIYQLGIEYISKRIKDSIHASEGLKGKYISLIKKQPAMMVPHFIAFLEKENEYKDEE